MSTTPEGALKSEIRKYLKTLGIFYFDVAGGAFGTKGAPDMIIVINGHWEAWEMKTYRGHLSPDQERFRDRLTAAGGVYRIIRSMNDVNAALDEIRA